MATNAKIKADIQKLQPASDLIDLYTLDATDLGGTVSYFTPTTEDGADVIFNGITYEQLPVEFEGLEITGDGRLPRPKMRVANVNLTFVGLINAYQDGIGAKVTRIRTFRKYLDSQGTADPNAQFPADIFYIEQKTIQNKYFIEWELIAPVDIGQRQIPKNQVLPYCQHRYRIVATDSTSFDYTTATCPYTGSNYFTIAGDTTTLANDKCGKKLSDCELRFPSPAQLPYKGFPVVGQVAQVYR